MKKLRKLLAGFMMLAMVISLLPMLAPITAYGDTSPTIDFNKTGSLTVNLREVASNYDGANHDNGEVNIAPDGQAYEGAKFQLYTVEDLTQHYAGSSEDLQNKQYTPVDDDKYGAEQTTNAEGKVTWTGLPLGIYYVVQTKQSPNATSELLKFFVSIPMTNEDGDDWLYDVNVYPKNKLTRGGLTLKKTGNGADLTDNAKFVLQYKTSSVDIGDWQSIKKDGETYTYGVDAADATEFSVNSNGVEFADLKAGYYRFIEVQAPDDDYIMDGKTTYNFTINQDSSISYTDTALSKYTVIDNTKTITIDNQKPTLVKKVKDRTSSEWVDETDYSKGATIPYQITIKVPENIKELEKFELTDAPSGLQDVSSSLKVTYDGAEIVNTGNSVYTVSSGAPANGFKIEFTPGAMDAYKGKEIVITYNATLLSTAVTTSTGNPNTATLTYSNQILPSVTNGSTTDQGNPNNPPDPDNPPAPTTNTITDTTKVYTYQLKIIKSFSAAPTGTYSANFKLYKDVNEGTTGATTLKFSDGSSKYGIPVDLDLDKSDDLVTITASNNGDDATTVSNTGYFNGLEKGTYYLVETSTASGYNLLKEPVTITIAGEYSSMTPKEQNITNNKGFTLPITGGVGTYIFIFVGVSMMAAAVILFFVTKKKDVKKSI